MIEKLTPEQLELLEVYRERWIGYSLSTEPANRAEAEKGIRLCYQTTPGLKQPERIVWCGSPLEMARVRATYLAQRQDGPVKQLADTIYKGAPAARKKLFRSMTRHADHPTSHLDEWASQLFVNPVEHAIAAESVEGAIVPQSLLNAAGAAMRDFIKSCTSECCYGQHDGGWLGFYDYCHEVLGLASQTRTMHGIVHQAKHGGWFAPHEDVCFVCERPESFAVDSQNYLHNETGAALAWRDGWKVYALHGVRVPGGVIMDPQNYITCDRIKNETNVEVQRIMIDRMGWPKFLEESEAKLVDERKNAVEATKEALFDSAIGRVLVCGCPSTARVYCLRVPDDTPSCEAAQAYLSSGLSSRIIAAT